MKTTFILTLSGKFYSQKLKEIRTLYLCEVFAIADRSDEPKRVLKISSSVCHLARARPHCE